ncbi:MAG TPA: rhomboid family intramembrane serine protease [Thermoanaerobaculia bacterium]|nr:rhomboid family intramembrane serine protease [Thermoanaerobaculia bacterium]
MIPLRDLNPSRRRPFVTVALIAVNLVAFLYELALGPELQGFLQEAAFVPARLFEESLPAGAVAPEGLSVLVSMFLHGGWMHFLGNMLFLWVFGDNVEDRLGHLRYVVFYLACGYAAALAHAAANPASGLPAIGASGAIAGVLGAYLLLHPRAPIVTLIFLGFFITTTRVPAIVYLPLWFGIQFVSGLASLGAQTGTSGTGGVAWFAHIGGFVAGFVFLALLGGLRRPRRRPAPAGAPPPGVAPIERYRTGERGRTDERYRRRR